MHGKMHRVVPQQFSNALQCSSEAQYSNKVALETVDQESRKWFTYLAIMFQKNERRNYERRDWMGKFEPDVYFCYVIEINIVSLTGVVLL